MSQNKLYYYTYEAHPDSPLEEFRYDGLLFAMSDHHAHSQTKDMIAEIDAPEVENDLGVHLITPVGSIAREFYHLDDEDLMDVVDTTNSRLLKKARESVSEANIREVGDRQEKADLVEMGEEVEGMLTIDADELEDIGDPYN